MIFLFILLFSCTMGFVEQIISLVCYFMHVIGQYSKPLPVCWVKIAHSHLFLPFEVHFTCKILTKLDIDISLLLLFYFIFGNDRKQTIKSQTISTYLNNLPLYIYIYIYYFSHYSTSVLQGFPSSWFSLW